MQTSPDAQWDLRWICYAGPDRWTQLYVFSILFFIFWTITGLAKYCRRTAFTKFTPAEIYKRLLTISGKEGLAELKDLLSRIPARLPERSLAGLAKLSNGSLHSGSTAAIAAAADHLRYAYSQLNAIVVNIKRVWILTLLMTVLSMAARFARLLKGAEFSHASRTLILLSGLEELAADFVIGWTCLAFGFVLYWTVSAHLSRRIRESELFLARAGNLLK